MNEFATWLGLAIALASLAVNLIRHNQFGVRRIKVLLARAGAILVIVISGAAVVGHVTESERLYKWFAKDVGMAINTAVCLVVAGATAYGLVDIIATNGHAHSVDETAKNGQGKE